MCGHGKPSTITYPWYHGRNPKISFVASNHYNYPLLKTISRPVVVFFCWGGGEALGFVLFFWFLKISHFCNLKNVILTHMKDFCRKLGAAWDHGFEMCECTSYYEGICSQV
jgi:hypothetical protein